MATSGKQMKTTGQGVHRGWYVAFILGAIWFSFGCNPGTLSVLLSPFIDDKVPAECKLASKEKEITVAIMCTFGQQMETRLEVASAANELGEVFAAHLRKRCADNKEKVKIVPCASVVSFLNNRTDRRGVSSQDIGKHFKADYVISLEIDNMTLFDKGSQLYRGNADIDVKAYGVTKAAGEAVIFTKNYRVQHPNESSAPIEASGANIPQFRSMFLNKIAGDLARYFTAHPREIGSHMDGIN